MPLQGAGANDHLRMVVTFNISGVFTPAQIRETFVSVL
jgi:hypothetical protein